MSSWKYERVPRYGWWVVVALAIMECYVLGTYAHSFTAFFNPIVDEFAWSYALVSLAFSFRGFESGITAPIVGVLADRYSARRLFLLGSVVMALGFLLLSSTRNLLTFYAACIIIPLGNSLASPVVAMTAVAKWTTKDRPITVSSNRPLPRYAVAAWLTRVMND